MPQEIRSTIPQLYVTVDGKALPAEAFDAILEGVIETGLHLPDTCTLRIHDNDFKWLDGEHWKEGNQIRIEAGQGRDQLDKVFEGEITNIELDLAAMGVATLTVRCMDKAHRLHRGKNRETFTNVCDSDIVEKIAQKNGFTCDVDKTRTVQDWVLQNNQSDWEFLQYLAQRNGYRLYLQDKTKLNFKKVSDQTDNELEMEWGKDLRSFRVRVNNSNQVDSVTVKGWDPAKKRTIVGKAQTAEGTAKIGKRSEGGKVAKQAFGKAEMVVVDRPVFTQQEADAMAQSVCDDIGNSFIEADGLCYNLPKLTAGSKIKLKNVGDRFNGSYVVTSATHTFSAAEGFSTQFSISGKQPPTLMSILGGGGAGEKSPADLAKSHKVPSVVIGIVTDNMDPENLGRVKLKFPWLDDSLTSFWARIATPMAGLGRGFMFLPEVDDEVLVAFEHGDPNRPYVIGSLWNGQDKPPMPNDKAVSGGKVRHRRIKTRYGHMIDLDDNGRIVIQTNGGHRMTLSDNGGSLSLTSKKGYSLEIYEKNSHIAMFTPGGHAIGINDLERFLTLQEASGNTVRIDGMSGIITIDAINSVILKGGAALNISAAMINLNGPPAAPSKGKIDPEASEAKEVENT